MYYGPLADGVEPECVDVFDTECLTLFLFFFASFFLPFCTKRLVGHKMSTSGLPIPAEAALQNELACTTCAKTGGELLRCSKCKRVYYCSAECQTKDWYARILGLQLCSRRRPTGEAISCHASARLHIFHHHHLLRLMILIYPTNSYSSSS